MTLTGATSFTISTDFSWQTFDTTIKYLSNGFINVLINFVVHRLIFTSVVRCWISSVQVFQGKTFYLLWNFWLNTVFPQNNDDITWVHRFLKESNWVIHHFRRNGKWHFFKLFHHLNDIVYFSRTKSWRPLVRLLFHSQHQHFVLFSTIRQGFLAMHLHMCTCSFSFEQYICQTSIFSSLPCKFLFSSWKNRNRKNEGEEKKVKTASNDDNATDKNSGQHTHTYTVIKCNFPWGEKPTSNIRSESKKNYMI